MGVEGRDLEGRLTHTASMLCARRSAWLKPCCGKRAAAWQVFLLSASVNSLLVACVVLVVTLLTLELLIDVKLLQCE